jgi:hypothetical protein
VGRVFISYSHDSDAHKARVHALAVRLRGDGVTVVLDRDMLPGGPADGWPAWSERQVKETDFVLVACTERYHLSYEGKMPPGIGLGTADEAAAIRQFIHDQAGFNEKFRVILFEAGDAAHIPIQLRRYHSFQPLTEASYTEMLAWLQGLVAPVTTAPPMPPVIRWPSVVPGYSWRLADRKEECALFDKMVTGCSPRRILLVRASSNSGKTVLLAELLCYARHLKLAAALLDFKGCPSLDEMFQSLRLDLGSGILRSAHDASGAARFYHLISDLQQLGVPLVLIFDAYEQGPEEARKWLESQLLPRLDRAPGVVVVIGGQEVPEHAKHTWHTLAEFCDLQPIHQPDDWLEYIRRKWNCPGLQPAHVQTLTMAAGGDPGQVSALLETLVRRLPGSSLS